MSSWFRWIVAATVLLTCAACNNDDDSPPQPTATPTRQATNTAAPTGTPTAAPTETAEPEPTATPDEAGHVEVEIGSSDDGGGQLVAEIAFAQPVALFFNQCFGGSDEDCTGGQALFSDANPGFVGHHDHGEEEAGTQGSAADIFPLLETTQVSIEIVAIDSGLRLRLGAVTLDTPGASTLLGSGPEFHADGESLLLVDDRHTEQVYSLTFRLTADSGYAASEEYTLQFVASNQDHADDHTDAE